VSKVEIPMLVHKTLQGCTVKKNPEQFGNIKNVSVFLGPLTSQLNRKTAPGSIFSKKQ